MRAFLFLIFSLPLAIESNANTCEMIDDPAGYRYLECAPAKIKAAREASRAAAKANEGKPKPKAGHEMSVEEFAAQMAVKNAANEKERAAAEAQSEALRREENRKQAEVRRRQAAAAERAEAEFKHAAEAGALGSWRYALEEDRMGGGQTKTAATLSKNQISFGFPYQGRQRATLLLRAHPRYGRDVMLSVEKGQFICGIAGCNVIVRFGSGKPQRYSANPPSDHSSTVLFIEGHDRFVTNASKVEKLLIEAAFFQEGNRVLEFDVAALKWPFGPK